MSTRPNHVYESSEVLPKVLILAAGDKRTIKTSYTNIDVKYHEPTLFKNGPSFFNHFNKQAQSYDIIGYMNEKSNFTNEDDLNKIVSSLWYNAIIGGVYCDAQIVNLSNDLLFYQIHPSYDPRLFYNKFVVNGPLFLKSSVVTPFNEEFNTLYMWDMFINCCKSMMMFHIPLPLITIIHDSIQNKDVSKEYKVIYEKVKAQ